MMTSGLKKKIGLSIAAAFVAAALGTWVFLSIRSPAGNLFQSSLPGQLLLYGRLAGILMALSFLFQLLSMGKGRMIEQFLPKALLFKTHKRLGFTTGILLLVHIVLIFLGRSMLYDDSFGKVASRFLFDGKWGSLAGLGFLMLAAVLFFSALFVWKKMVFTSWKKTHYLTYVLVLFFFFHQIFYGFDFVHNPAFRIFWIGLFLLVTCDVVMWKLRSRSTV